MKRHLVLAAAVLATAGATGWYFTKGGGATGRAAAASAAAASAAAPAAPIELAASDVALAQLTPMVQTLAISGSLKAVQSAFVKARVAAEIKSLTVREGDRVSAGQLIGRIDPTEYQLRLRQAEDQSASAKAQLDIAERTLANNQALVNQGFISQNALDTSVSSAAGARASLQASRATADLARKAVRDSDIRAPIGGLVSQRFVQPGERVGLDARLIEIVDLSQVELEASVAPEDVPSLRIGQVARLGIDGLAEPLAARVVRINPSAVAGTRAVLAYLLVTPHPALRQGLFARGSIELQKREVLAVPASAVRSDQAQPYVLVFEAGSAVQRVVVMGARGDAVFGTGSASEPAVEVSSGLATGAPVLRASVGGLRAGTRLALPARLGTAPKPAGGASTP
jgi:membrane fusion protein, multidrug efflux system